MQETELRIGHVLILLGLIGGLLVAVSYGMFYVTGSQFYQACWEMKAKAKAIGGFKDPEANNPSQAVLWANCTPIAVRGLENAGFLFGSSAQDASSAAKALVGFCPNRQTDVPAFLDFLYIPVIEWIEKTGGPSLIDHFAPAEWLVWRAISARWPRCSAAVVQLREQIQRERDANRSIGGSSNAFERCRVCNLPR